MAHRACAVYTAYDHDCGAFVFGQSATRPLCEVVPGSTDLSGVLLGDQCRKVSGRRGNLNPGNWALERKRRRAAFGDCFVELG